MLFGEKKKWTKGFSTVFETKLLNCNISTKCNCLVLYISTENSPSFINETYSNICDFINSYILRYEKACINYCEINK
jgi:hypothetical protein